MATPDSAVISLNGVPCTVQDILSTINANTAFASAVRMKALERMVAERDMQLAATEGDNAETPDETEGAENPEGQEGSGQKVDA